MLNLNKSMEDRKLPPFHMAFPVSDIENTKIFYRDMLGCDISSSTDRWVIINFWGHQVVAHLNPDDAGKSNTNEIDGNSIPVKHFGMILDWDQWEELVERLKNSEVDFIIDPYVRFEGEPTEEGKMFFKDPSGNALEFKTFRKKEQIFAK